MVAGLAASERNRLLLGVTGSGKTYTMAKVIERAGRAAPVLAANKSRRNPVISPYSPLNHATPNL